MKKIIIFILTIYISVFGQTSENYTVETATFTVCGNTSTSEDYVLIDAIGQPSPLGTFASENYFIESGLFNAQESSTKIVDEELPIPAKFHLENNYPNPFNPTTTIEYSIPEDSDVTISIYDLNGKLIQTLVDDNKTAGFHKTIWNATNTSSGVYFYKITAGDFTAVKKCVLMK